MKDYLFPDYPSQLYQGYLTSVLLAWINARCVSFALDRIWYKVERESLVTSFLMVTAFSFYLPLGVMGPLVSSKTFKESFTSPAPVLTRAACLDILTQCVRYAVWFSVTDISLYFLYQQALTLHVSINITEISIVYLINTAYNGEQSQLVGRVWYGLLHGAVLPAEVCGDVRHVESPGQDGRGGGPRPPRLHGVT